MHDLVPAAEVGVLVADRVEAVRARGHDLLDARSVKRVDVLTGQALERELVAHPARRVPGASFARAEDREIDAGREHQLGRRDSALARAFVEGGSATDPEQDVRCGIARLQHTDSKSVGPVGAVGLRLAPGIG